MDWAKGKVHSNRPATDEGHYHVLSLLFPLTINTFTEKTVKFIRICYFSFSDTFFNCSIHVQGSFWGPLNFVHGTWSLWVTIYACLQEQDYELCEPATENWALSAHSRLCMVSTCTQQQCPMPKIIRKNNTRTKKNTRFDSSQHNVHSAY